MKAVWVATLVAAFAYVPALAQAPMAEPAALPDPPAPLVDAYLRHMSKDAVFKPAPGELTVAQGEVKDGDRIVAWPVTYARTGVLSGEASYSALLGRTEVALPSGAKMFAMPYDSQRTAYAPIRHGQAWCGVAPRGDSDKVKGVCLIDFGKGFETVAAYGHNVIMPDSAYVPGETAVLGEVRGVPQVLEQPVDFGVKLESAYTFQGWKKNGAEVRRAVYDPKGRTGRFMEMTLKREVDGSALLRVGGGVLRLKPAGDDERAVIETVEAPKLDSDDIRRARAAAALRDAYPGRGRAYPVSFSAADLGTATRTP